MIYTYIYNEATLLLVILIFDIQYPLYKDPII